MQRLTMFVPLFIYAFLLSLQAQEATINHKMSRPGPLLETYFDMSDLVEQSQPLEDLLKAELSYQSSSAYLDATQIQADAGCAVTGNVLSQLSPDRKYTFTFARLKNCGADVVLFSRGIQVNVNGKIVTNWERRRLALGEIRELLFNKGVGIRVTKLAGEVSDTNANSRVQPNAIELPGVLVDIINAIIGISSEVCQMYGYDQTTCNLVEGGLKLLSNTTIKKAKDNVFFDKSSVLPTLYFANVERYKASKEAAESYVWIATILQGRSDYAPHERLFLLVGQTANAHNDARAGQAWARVVEQLPQ